MDWRFIMLLLQIAAVMQVMMAGLNLFIVPLLKWQEELRRAPLLLREVFQVHAWFISITLLIFGIVTWRFAAELAGCPEPFGRWVATGIGIFWGIRTFLQVAYYSSSHWRGNPGRTVVHILLLLTYGGFATVYLWSAFGTEVRG